MCTEDSFQHLLSPLSRTCSLSSYSSHQLRARRQSVPLKTKMHCRPTHHQAQAPHRPCQLLLKLMNQSTQAPRKVAGSTLQRYHAWVLRSRTARKARKCFCWLPFLATKPRDRTARRTQTIHSKLTTCDVWTVFDLEAPYVEGVSGLCCVSGLCWEPVEICTPRLLYHIHSSKAVFRYSVPAVFH